MTQLYIPKRIKVGYQKREGTYSGKLAYIVYLDDKGILRKEASWNSWRDNKITPIEFDNEPTEGFVLHKDIKRYQWSSHFGSKRTMIRVWDPREIEFEITTENLIGVLMNSDCAKRGLVGKFVYAWAGPELVLLPCCSEEYQSATTYTSLQSKSVGVKDLVPGCGYKTKKEVDLIYVGRFPWYVMDHYRSGKRTAKKRYIFARQPDGDYEKRWQWEVKTSLDFLTTRTTEQPVTEFAQIVESYQKCIHSAAITKWEVKPVEVSIELSTAKHHWQPTLKRSTYFRMIDDALEVCQVEVKSDWDDTTQGYLVKGYYTTTTAHLDTSTQIYSGGPSYWRWNDHYGYNPLTADQLKQQTQDWGDLYVTLDNGRRIKLDSLYDI